MPRSVACANARIAMQNNCLMRSADVSISHHFSASCAICVPPETALIQPLAVPIPGRFEGLSQ